MNQDDLRRLSQIRVEEARVLLAAGLGSGADYLAGYAVECALKAFIARRTLACDFPREQLVLDSHTHDIEKLVTLTELRADRDVDIRVDPNRKDNWGLVGTWTESARYNIRSIDKAQALHLAASDPDHGV